MTNKTSREYHLKFCGIFFLKEMSITKLNRTNKGVILNFDRELGDEKTEIPVLKQTGAGSFESIMCNECGIIKTNQRCLEAVKSEGYKDWTRQICGSPFCLICANARRCTEGVMTCKIHNYVDL